MKHVSLKIYHELNIISASENNNVSFFLLLNERYVAYFKKNISFKNIQKIFKNCYVSPKINRP